MHKTFVATLALALAVAMPAGADLAAGRAALDSGDYARAAEELRPLAGSDKEAAHLLAGLYRRGQGVPESWADAANWYRAAASRGHAEAQFEYAAALEFGRGVVTNRKEAFDWYLKAARQGHVPAMTQAGRFHLYGIHKPANFLEARRWLNKAAEAGDVEAQALIDEVLRRNALIIDIPGTANPTDEAARRVLGEVRDLVAPLLGDPSGSRVRIGQPPTVMAVEGGHAVVLPMVELAAVDGATVRLGNVRITFQPDGEDYSVKVALPARAGLIGRDKRPIGTVTLGRHEITGRWSSSLHTLADYRAELVDLRLTTASGAMGVTIGAITGSRGFKPLRAGHYDVVETIEARDMRFDYELGGRRQSASLGGALYMLQYLDMDVVALSQAAERFGMDWRTGLRVRPVAGEAPPDAFPPMLRDMLITVQARNLTVEDAAGKRLGGFDDAEFSLGGANLDAPLSALTLSYAHHGMTAEGMGAEGVPHEVRVNLGAARVPAPQAASVTLSTLHEGMDMGTRQADRLARRGDMAGAAHAVMMSPVNALAGRGAALLNGVLGAAQAELRINEVSLKADGYQVALNGRFRPSSAGLSGQVDMRVLGAEQFAKALRDGRVVVNGLDPADLIPSRALALQDVLEGGRRADFYRMVLLQDGSVTVNGKPLADTRKRR